MLLVCKNKTLDASEKNGDARGERVGLLKQCEWKILIGSMYDICLTNIAMENGPFEDVFPINKKRGYSIAMLVYQRVHFVEFLW